MIGQAASMLTLHIRIFLYMFIYIKDVPYVSYVENEISHWIWYDTKSFYFQHDMSTYTARQLCRFTQPYGRHNAYNQY